MEEFITGYQYGDKKEYSGEYHFPNNLDKEKIHLPPNTTLIAPPIPEAGFFPKWNGEAWELVPDENLSGNLADKLDYVNLLPEFIQEQKEYGLWTEEMQSRYDAAQAEKAEQERLQALEPSPDPGSPVVL